MQPEGCAGGTTGQIMSIQSKAFQKSYTNPVRIKLVRIQNAANLNNKSLMQLGFSNSSKQIADLVKYSTEFINEQRTLHFPWLNKKT